MIATAPATVTSFSFITPSYNYASVVRDCLRSVAAQDAVPGVTYEHIVVDDGSSDASVETITASGFPLKMIEQHNQGQGAALNNGLSQARGDWVC